MKTIELTRGQVAIVDDEDFERLSKMHWAYLKQHKGIGGYAVHYTRIDRKVVAISMHRFLMNAPKGFDIDHKNGDGLDNRKSNLRICTRAQNMRNSRIRAGRRFKGVYRTGTPSQPYCAQIGVNYQRIFLGTHASEEEAARAYDQAAIKYHGEFARLNFPQQSEVEKQKAA